MLVRSTHRGEKSRGRRRQTAKDPGVWEETDGKKKQYQMRTRKTCSSLSPMRRAWVVRGPQLEEKVS